MNFPTIQKDSKYRDPSVEQILTRYSRLSNIIQDCLKREESLDEKHLDCRSELFEITKVHKKKVLAQLEVEKLKQQTRLNEQSAQLEKEQKLRIQRSEKAYQNTKGNTLKQHNQIRHRQENKLKQHLDQVWDEFQKTVEQKNRENKHKVSVVQVCLQQLEENKSKLEKKCKEFRVKPHELDYEALSYPNQIVALQELFDQQIQDNEDIIENTTRKFWVVLGRAFLPLWGSLLISSIVAILAAWALLTFSFEPFKLNKETTIFGIAGLWLVGSSVSTLLASYAQSVVKKKLFPLLSKTEDSIEYIHQFTNNLKQNLAELEKQLKSKRDEIMLETQDKLEELGHESDEQLKAKTTHIESKTKKLLKKVKRRYREKLEQLQKEGEKEFKSIEEKFDKKIEFSKGQKGQLLQEKLDEIENERNKLKDRWNVSLRSFNEKAEDINKHLSNQFPSWNDMHSQKLNSPQNFPNAIPLGNLNIHFEETFCQEEDSSSFEKPHQIEIPLALQYPNHSSLCVQSDSIIDSTLINFFHNIILRLLSTHPPGKIKLTLIDPIGLGRHFAGLMKLSDSTNCISGSRILTNSSHISEALDELSQHIEKVIQKYLMNDYETIDEYNQAAGETAEANHILVLLDFPQHFDDLSLVKLMSILNSGPRCGITTLIHSHNYSSLPANFKKSHLQESCLNLIYRNKQFFMNEDSFKGFTLVPEEPIEEDQWNELIESIIQIQSQGEVVRVPFSRLHESEKHLWNMQSQTELQVPIGFSGANQVQWLKLGLGMKQHALVAGRTGSGKSTLFHSLITSIGHCYSPKECQLYLVDFKKGVEFKIYADHQLPHAKVIGIESDREFGLSVLRQLDDMLSKRGTLFRQAGANDLDSFRNERPELEMPRILLIVDEFQELFVEEDQISSDAALLFDRLIRQGRAFGIHLVLGSQTLAGAYTLARSTMGQIAIRVALQCNESDSSLILSDENTAAKHLSRPGEAIYNNASGRIEGNQPFQVAWLDSSEHKEQLRKVREFAKQQNQQTSPFVFEGNAPGLFSQSQIFNQDVLSEANKDSFSIGAANAIAGDCQFDLKLDSSQNILLLGQRRSESLSIFIAILTSMLKHSQTNSTTASLFLNIANADVFDKYKEPLRQALGEQLNIIEKKNEEKRITELYENLLLRENGEAEVKQKHLVMVHGLQFFKYLHQKDDFSFSSSEDETISIDKQWTEIIERGPMVGIHVVLWCDTLAHAQRMMSRKHLESFDWRILFQMAAQDSVDLIDQAIAHKLSLHQAILYRHNDGFMQKFRPFELPSVDEWKAWITSLVKS